MDNIITGVIGIGLFLLFIGGLAQSIGALPFVLIVICIAAMAIYALYEDIQSSKKGN